MTALRIDEAGPLTSVQDVGRFGAQRYGLGPSGAMDRFALAAANALVGQPLAAAAIEIGPLGARFTACDGGVTIALAGTARDASVGARSLPLLASARLEEGETLVLKPARGGLFSYLAVAGGIAGEPVFGSLAVHARAGLGSPYPRPLRAGDRLMLQRTPAPPPVNGRTVTLAPAHGPIRVVPGPQDDYFTDAALTLFFNSHWRVSAQFDRMGYRLEGPRLVHARSANIVSDGTVTGHIQVPGNGQPLVLMPERGTTGGYPKLGAIITADLGRFAQTPPGSDVRFQAVSVAEAQHAARNFAAQLAALPRQVRAMDDGISLERLMRGDVAGQAVNALDTETWQDVPAGTPPGDKRGQ
jgi:biotin-dependent carboxylase-like uncharacterized protein